MNTVREPVAFTVALGGLLTSGVALVAVFVPGLTPAMTGAVIVFGNAVILTGSIWYARRQVTPVAAPVLPAGAPVTTPEGLPAVVAVATTKHPTAQEIAR